MAHESNKVVLQRAGLGHLTYRVAGVEESMLPPVTWVIADGKVQLVISSDESVYVKTLDSPSYLDALRFVDACVKWKACEVYLMPMSSTSTFDSFGNCMKPSVPFTVYQCVVNKMA